MNSVWRMVILVLVGLTMPALAQLTDEIKEISFKEVDYNYSRKDVHLRRSQGSLY